MISTCMFVTVTGEVIVCSNNCCLGTCLNNTKYWGSLKHAPIALHKEHQAACPCTYHDGILCCLRCLTHRPVAARQPAPARHPVQQPQQHSSSSSQRQCQRLHPHLQQQQQQPSIRAQQQPGSQRQQLRPSSWLCQRGSCSEWQQSIIVIIISSSNSRSRSTAATPATRAGILATAATPAAAAAVGGAAAAAAAGAAARRHCCVCTTHGRPAGAAGVQPLSTQLERDALHWTDVLSSVNTCTAAVESHGGC